MDIHNLPKLDRRVQFDEKSRAFAAVPALGLEDKPLRSYTWRCYVWNNQGTEGACVGYMFSHELAARPFMIKKDENFAMQIYRRARQLDPWEGEDYDGTSVLAGMKALQELKNSKGKRYIEEYRWAFGIEDVLKVLGRHGPVGLGMNWYYDMYFPDAKGFIRPTGSLAGGHAILARGVKIVKLDKEKPATIDNVDFDKSYVRLHNSWGKDWGIEGTCFITVRDLDKLLQEDGEAIVPLTRNYV